MGIRAQARHYAVVSGKGGVGKTVITANVAAELAARGKRTLVVDADLGLANLDVLLGVNPKHSLHDVLHGTRSIEDVLVRAPGGFDLLPAGSGLAEGPALTSVNAEKLKTMISQLDSRYDAILFDAGAGIGEVVMFFARLAEEILLVVTPEPTSLMDAYATIKILSRRHGRNDFSLIVNQVDPAGPEKAGERVTQHLQMVVNRFLTEGGQPVKLRLLGSIPMDPAVARAISRQQLLAHTSPQAPSTQLISRLAETCASSLPPTLG